MVDQFFDIQYAENIIKRLRRFAASLTADRQLADAAVLDAVRKNTRLLYNDGVHGTSYIELLITVYQLINDIDLSYMLITPENMDDRSPYSLFQSLHYTDKAIISLLLIEQLIPETIAVIVDMPLQHIQSVIDEYIGSCLREERV